MQELAGIDATFLYLETETAHMHVVGTIVLDGEGGTELFDRVRRRIASRLHEVPAFRQRLVHVPLRLGHPVWVDDPDFRLGAHLHRIALPQPGSMRELSDFVAHVAAIPLDRERPLWELWVVEGLADKRTALVCKFHHAAIDGVSGADLMQHLFDVDPDAADDEPPAWTPEPAPSELTLLAHAVGELALQPARVVQTAAKTAVSLADVASAYLDPRSLVRNPALPLASPETMVNDAISSDRSTAFGQVSLADIKTIKNALGMTVNDVILAACSLALREYLLEHDEVPDEPLVATIPVSMHGDAHGPSNNAVSAMFVRLPTHLEKPLDHLRFVQSEAAEAKELHRSSRFALLAEWAEYASPTWFAALMNLYSRYNLAESHSPLYNLVVSNVPGPPMPLYCAGHRVLDCYPLGPIFEGSAVNLTVMSYVDRVDIGVIACPDVAPEIDHIVESFEKAVTKLLKLVGNSRPNKPKPRKKRHR